MSWVIYAALYRKQRALSYQNLEISELRQAVLDKTVYVKQRREILLEDTAKGLQEGRWAFFVELK